MQLIIKKESYDRLFIYSYLKDYIFKAFNEIVDKNRFINLDRYFNINSYEIILFALRNLCIYENSREYTIKINKNLKYKSTNISGLINVITFGNRDVRGYPIIYDIFELVAKNIDIMYNIWLGGV